MAADREKDSNTAQPPPDMTPADAMARAVADLWSQPVEKGSEHIVFYDHDGTPARIRYENGAYIIAWAVEDGVESRWDELSRAFDNPRQAALHAFQGPVRGR